MSVIEFKIPNDPLVCRAMANYLLGLTGDKCPDGDGRVVAAASTEALEDEAQARAELRTTLAGDPSYISVIADGDGRVVAAAPELDPRGSEAAPAPADTGVQLDKTGLPWDGRIHASSKALLQDQTWRKKRGVADFLVTQVEAELRAAMAAPAPAPTATEAVADALVDVLTPTPTPGVQTTSQAEATPPNAAAAAFGATAGAGAASAMTLADLIVKITQAAIPMDKVLTVLNAKGLAALPLLDSRPDLIPEVATELGLQ